MSRAALSIAVFAAYLLLMGAGLLLVPNSVLALSNTPPTNEVWVRVVGIFALYLAYYYAQAARTGNLAFMRWTVHTRLTVPLFFGALVLFFNAQASLMLFSVVDVLAAL